MISVVKKLEHRISFIWVLFRYKLIVMIKNCMYICSYGRESDGFSMCFNSDMVSLMVLYSCL